MRDFVAAWAKVMDLDRFDLHADPPHPSGPAAPRPAPVSHAGDDPIGALRP